MAILPREVDIQTAVQAQAASRSQVYQLLASVFAFPTPQAFEEIKAGHIWHRLRDITSGLPYAFPIEEPTSLTLALSFEQFQSQYIGIFEVGPGSAPPCPLYEGSYWGGRAPTMAELLSFYHYFGLALSQQQHRELPDHLSVELEFMHALTFKEAMATQEGKKVEPYWRAERDFLGRHLVDFLAAIGERLRPVKAAFFPHMVTVAERFCRSDMAYVVQRLGR